MLRFPHLESNETFFITMAFYGYARVSTNDQDLDLQIQTLRAAGCEIIRSEKRAGPAAMDELSCNCCWIFCVRETR